MLVHSSPETGVRLLRRSMADEEPDLENRGSLGETRGCWGNRIAVEEPFKDTCGGIKTNTPSEFIMTARFHRRRFGPGPAWNRTCAKGYYSGLSSLTFLGHTPEVMRHQRRATVSYEHQPQLRHRHGSTSLRFNGKREKIDSPQKN